MATTSAPKPKTKKTKPIHFDVLVEEHQRVKAKAASEGLTIREYMRGLLKREGLIDAA